MDKFVILACVDPALFHKMYSNCADLRYQCAFSDIIIKKSLPCKTLNMIAYPNALHRYLQLDLMRQPMKIKSYTESMDVLWNFLWDYFYPAEHILMNMTAGKQFVIIHMLNIQDHIDKVLDIVTGQLKEHNYINVAKSNLTKIFVGGVQQENDGYYVNGNQDLTDMFADINSIMKEYLESYVDIVHGEDYMGKPLTYARLKDAASIYDATADSRFEETLPKNQRGKEIYEQNESFVR